MLLPRLVSVLTGLLHKALRGTVFGFQFLERLVFHTVYWLLKTENRF